MIRNILTLSTGAMTLTSQLFFWFLIVACVLYYYSFRKSQRYILLITSVLFYFAASNIKLYKLFAVVAYIISITYVGALLIDYSKGKLRTFLTYICVMALVMALFYLKSAYNLLSQILANPAQFGIVKFTSLIGVSYYTLSAIGYILDVNWEIYPAEKSLVNIALYILFFPQLVSGPVTRYSQMHGQFKEYHNLEFDNIYYGIRRMLWGYFKKLVISERFAVIVQVIYYNYKSYNGLIIIFATLCYAIQLYTDFSGCMDIIIGVAKLFGITLPENFNAPFFSLSLKEFWRRWHISLGTWFKDYVMYPVQMSNLMKYLRKKGSKKITFYTSMFVLWALIGLWHGGTTHYFIASGMIPFILITLSDIFSPFLTLKIDNLFLRIFRRFRTVLLMCISFVFICAGSVKKGIEIFRVIFLNFSGDLRAEISLAEYFNSIDIVLMAAGVVVLLCADYLQDKGSSITAIIDEQKGIIRYAVLYAEILAIMLFGMVGNSSFIYFQF